jgi:hypothetical protein
LGGRLDDTLSAHLFERTARQITEPVFRNSFWLLRRSYEPAALWDTVLMSEGGLRRLPAALVAAKERPERFWSTIWRLLEADRDWGRAFLTGFLNFGDQGGRLLPTITTQEAGSLLGWLLTEFPPNDEQDAADGAVSTRDHVRFFRSALIE